MMDALLLSAESETTSLSFAGWLVSLDIAPKVTVLPEVFFACWLLLCCGLSDIFKIGVVLNSQDTFGQNKG